MSLNDSSGVPPSPSSSASSTPKEKPKRVRRQHQRRPKALPSTIRQRLAVLGHPPTNNDTTDANLSEIINKLNSDLQSYTVAAEHWQNMFLALQSQDSRDKLADIKDVTSQMNTFSDQAPNPSAGPVTAAELDILGRLHRAVEPTLSLVNMTAPNLQSNMSRAHNIVYNDDAFNLVLKNISDMADLFGMFKSTQNTWSAISKLKPDFNEVMAKQVWYEIFQPINTPAHSINWNGTSSVRSENTFSAGDDPDYDALDRKLMTASDDEVVEMLHYSSLLVVGFGQAVFDEPWFEEARNHLGANCERLLREVIFTRNLSQNPRYAQGVLAGMIGLIRYLSFQKRFGAVVSILELGWQISEQSNVFVHPITKGLISFVSTLMASSHARRSLWMARNQEIFQSTSERYFHLCTTAYFTAAFYSLSTRDEDSLLYYLSLLEDHLGPKPGTKFAIGLSSDDPIKSDFLGLNAHPNAPPSQTPLVAVLNTPTATTPIIEPPPTGCVPVSLLGPFMVDSPSDLLMPHHSTPEEPFPFFEPQQHTQPTPQTIQHHVNAHSAHQPTFHRTNSPSPDAPSPASSVVSLSAASVAAHSMPQAMSHDMNFSMPLCFTSGQAPPPSIPAATSSPQWKFPAGVSSPSQMGEIEEHFVPNEHFKAVLRASANLLRAEGALMSNNVSMCRYWVDEAEKEILTVPDIFYQQKVFLVDVSLLKTIFRTVCPFPHGTHGIAEEFDRRMTAEADRRFGKRPRSASPAPRP